mgnify:CR=1 FL=1
MFDTPGRDDPYARHVATQADTLVTPMNDSFVDFDLIGQVEGESFKVRKLSFYAELIWEARKSRALKQIREARREMDWVVVRNRVHHTVRCAPPTVDCNAAAILLREGSDSNTVAENDLTGSSTGLRITGQAPLTRPSIGNLVYRNDASGSGLAFAAGHTWSVTFLENRGDSAAYGLKDDGTLSRFTTPHTLGEELRQQGVPDTEAAAHDHKLRHHVGRVPLYGVEGFEATARLLVLASDGLKVPHDELRTLLLDHGDDPQRCAEHLLAAARARGSRDDVTVLVIPHPDRPATTQPMDERSDDEPRRPEGPTGPAEPAGGRESDAGVPEGAAEVAGVAEVVT